MMRGLNGLNKHKCVCVSVCVWPTSVFLYQWISGHAGVWSVAGWCLLFLTATAIITSRWRTKLCSIQSKVRDELFLHLLLSFVSLGNTALTGGQWQLHDITLISFASSLSSCFLHFILSFNFPSFTYPSLIYPLFIYSLSSCSVVSSSVFPSFCSYLDVAGVAFIIVIVDIRIFVLGRFAICFAAVLYFPTFSIIENFRFIANPRRCAFKIIDAK